MTIMLNSLEDINGLFYAIRIKEIKYGESVIFHLNDNYFISVLELEIYLPYDNKHSFEMKNLRINSNCLIRDFNTIQFSSFSEIFSQIKMDLNTIYEYKDEIWEFLSSKYELNLQEIVEKSRAKIKQYIDLMTQQTKSNLKNFTLYFKNIESLDDEQIRATLNSSYVGNLPQLARRVVIVNGNDLTMYEEGMNVLQIGTHMICQKGYKIDYFKENEDLENIPDIIAILD